MTPGQATIRSCVCRSEYQDRVYGKGKRVHNAAKLEANKPQEFNCTVCPPKKLRGLKMHAKQHDPKKHG